MCCDMKIMVLMDTVIRDVQMVVRGNDNSAATRLITLAQSFIVVAWPQYPAVTVINRERI